AVFAFAGCPSHVPPVREDSRVTKGRTLYDQGRYEAAESHFRELLAQAAVEGDVLLEAQCRKWLGNIMLAYRKDDEALVSFARSRALLDSAIAQAQHAGILLQTARDERQNVLNNTAIILKNRGRFEEAAAVHREVLAYDRARGNKLAVAVSLNNLGTVYHAQADAARLRGDEASFHRFLDTARTLFRASLAEAQTADAWMNLGTAQAFSGRPDSAVAAFRKAHTMYRTSGYRVHEAMCLGNIGIILERERRPDEAAEALKRAIAIIEELRGDISSIDVRSSFVSNKYHLYERMVSILVGEGRVAEAFTYVERAKARSFLDMLGNKVIGETKRRPADLEALVLEERALSERIARILDVPDSAKALARAVERHRDLLGRLRAVDPEYASVKSIDPVPLSRLQAMLDDTTAVVEYFIGETVAEGARTAFVFVLRRDTIVARPLPLGARLELEKKVESLRRMLYADFPDAKTAALRLARLQKGASFGEALAEWRATPTDARWQYALAELYSILLFPVEPALSHARRVYIVPHGPLHHVPFHALVRPTNIDRRRDVHVPRPHYLIEDMTVAYLPSASVLPFARRKQGAFDGTGLVVGDPLYADPAYRRRPLEGALTEADSVAALIPRPLVRKRAEAEEHVVKRDLAAVSLAHFATHGELNKREPLRSRILLAAAEPDSVDDGNLTVAEVFNLDMKAVLVALSACQTAQVTAEGGAFTPGDDLVGLTRSFFYAGTPAVIASLWYVDDAATLVWMTSFYRCWLKEGLRKAEAARRAAMAMLENPQDPDWVVPYYWGAFIYFGDME
ncbi:MAG: CHAT domain-containing protein, partial [Bacteroidota bacterium]|nr:CHAT domain-containing protein [Bacteroidota bacterium]